MSLRARQNGGGKIRNAGGRGGGNGSPGGRGNNGGGATVLYWDPASKGNGVTLTNSNKTATWTAGTGFFDWAKSEKSINPVGLKAYFEVLYVSGGTGIRIGINNSTQNPEVTGPINPYLQQDFAGVITASSGVNGSAYTAGDVMGVAIDWTAAPNPTAYFFKNNVANGSAVWTGGTPALVVIGANDSASEAHSIILRTAVADFSYPVPSGYTAWATA